MRTKSAVEEDPIAATEGGKSGMIGNLTKGHGLITSADKEQKNKGTETIVREVTAIVLEVRVVGTKTGNPRRLNIRILGSILGSIREGGGTTIITDSHGSGQQTTIHKVTVAIRREMTIIRREMTIIRREMTIIRREMTLIRREMVVIHREVVIIHEEMVVVIQRKMDTNMIASDVSKTHLYVWIQS